MRSLHLDRATPVVIAVTVVAFAAGSSSVASVNHAGKTLRWVALFVLLAVAVTWALERRDRARPPLLLLAAAGGFVGLALLSSLWSVDPRLSAARAVSIGVLFVAAAALARAAGGRREVIEPLLAGLLTGAGMVALAGLVLLGVDHRDAVQSATYDVPWRYRGLGENPDTASLLLALVLPVALWFALTPRPRRERFGALALLLVFDGSIVASGSRGALVAGFVALFVLAALAPLRMRARLALAAGIAALAGFSVLGTQLPQATGKFVAATSGAAAAPPAPRKGYFNAEQKLPLSFDIGSSLTSGAPGFGHGLFGSSGRSVAWRGALDAADERPAVGYGFGTEARVFVDRYALFEGGNAENSYIGLDLQLGAVGVVLFLALVAAAVGAMLRARALPGAAVCLAVVAAGLTLAAVQSYVYSVGDIGTATFWLCAFLGAALLPPRRVPA